MRRVLLHMMFGLAILSMTACGEDVEVAVPLPQELTRDAIGYYCNMIVADHEGPKAQVFLAGESAPIWFSSVRDAIAFTLLPDEPKNIAAIYVNDMAKASWYSPEPETWIAATDATFVIESRARGGMGAAEAVPFSQAKAAQSFAAERGGRVVLFKDIPSAYILSSDEDQQAHVRHSVEVMEDGHGGSNAVAGRSHDKGADHAP